jgi:hypothetical protein
MSWRVAPLPRSSRSARVASPGCPFPAPFLLSRRPIPQVAPWLRTFGCAGDVHSSCPELRMPLALPVSARFRVSPVAPASSCSACDGGLGLPLVLHLRLYRRWIIECPDIRIIRRCRLADPQVAPILGLFGIADDSQLELPRTLNPPAPIDGYPSYLGSRTIRFASVELPSCPGHSPLLRRSTNFQVALNLGSLTVRRFPPFELPRKLVPRLTRICFLGLPRFRIYG